MGPRTLMLAILIVGCSVDIPDGRLRCASDGECPPGYSCLAAVCRAPGTDAGLADAPSAAETVVDLDCGNTHSCALTSEGRVFCWGDDRSGQIGEDGVADALPITTPTLVATLPAIEAIGVGDDFTCALDSGVAVHCWGTHRAGQLGDAAVADTGSPTPNEVSALTSPTALAVGGAHACAIVTGGAVRCWGQGSSGELGNGANAIQRTPVAVTLPAPARAITLGLTHSCALLEDQRVFCWGSDDRSELGEPGVAATSSNVPVQVTGLPATIDHIEAIAAHTCIVAAGVVSCWGWNASGELGGGSTMPDASSARVTAMVPMGDVADVGGGGFTFFGGAHTCAAVDGALRCWGRNLNGELGIGTNTLAVPAPMLVSLTDVSVVAGGPVHTCAIAGGQAYCWGLNDRGRLGNGSETSTNAPGEPIAIPLR